MCGDLEFLTRDVYYPVGEQLILNIEYLPTILWQDEDLS